MTYRITLVGLVVAVLFASGPAFVQGQRRTVERAPAVFPPLTAAQAGDKRRILESIKAAPSADGRRPNIVLLFADDLGYADIGCFGSTVIPTPYIDSLARRGTRFTDAYVTAGTCSPSRAGLLSGRYQQRFGFEFNTGSRSITERQGRGLDPSALIISDVLRQAGYATGMVGKWHQGTRAQFHPQQRGFDEFFGFLPGAHSYLDANLLSEADVEIAGGGGSSRSILRGTVHVDETEYLTDAFAREAELFIERHEDHPFFLYVPFNAVHTPIQATQKYRERFSHVTDLKRRTYYAMTSALDDAVGRILAAIDANHLTENTLVIFFNDNGGPIYTNVQDNGPLRLGKLFLFEGGVRVPMIMRWPGVIAQNHVHSDVVSSLDLFPTFCAIAGAPLPSTISLDGANLLPTLTGNSTAPLHEALFWRNGSNKAVRKGKWKMVKAGDYVWLFDLSVDIGESVNVAKDHEDVVRDLERSLSEWESGLKDAAWPPRAGARTVEVDGVPYKINI